MKASNRPVGEDDLTAYVDGELSVERRALVEAWLLDHPQARKRVEADLAVNRRLGEALAPIAQTSLPSRFRVENVERAMRARRLAVFRSMAAALLLLVAGGASGWFLKDFVAQFNGDSRIVADAMTAHRVYVAEKLHPVEVSADAKDHLGTWLGNRIGRKVAIPDLSHAGLKLVGGRLLPGHDGPSGQIMYESETGERVTLYLEAGSGEERRFAFRKYEDSEALAWRSPELAFVLTGPYERERLVAIAHDIHRSAGR